MCMASNGVTLESVGEANRNGGGLRWCCQRSKGLLLLAVGHVEHKMDDVAVFDDIRLPLLWHTGQPLIEC